MALFNKLFSTNKKRSTSSTSQKSSVGQFPFNADQVRVILFRECDIRGRKLLFDSSAVDKVPDASSLSSSAPSKSVVIGSAPNAATAYKTIPQVQQCDHCGVLYQHSTHPKSDIKSMAEMIFGSAPIAFQGSSLKVHWLRAPKSIMYSHIFPASARHTTGAYCSTKKTSITTYLGSDLVSNSPGGMYYDRHPSGSDLSSVDTSSLRSFTVTSPTSTQHDTSYYNRQRPPLPPEFSHLDRLTDPRLSTNSEMDSGYGGNDPWATSSGGFRCTLSSHRSSLASICSDYECFRRLSTDTNADIPQTLNNANLGNSTQYGSFYRRMSKNMSTSFENRHTTADHVGHVDELSQESTSSTSGQVTASDSCVGGRNRRNSETLEPSRRKAFSGEVHSTTTTYQGRPPSKKARLGIALCIQLNASLIHEMEAFCSEHMSIFESMLCRLRVSAENACHRWPQFLQIMLAAWHSTQLWLVDFFTIPRLLNPVWLTLSTGLNPHSSLNSTYPNRTAVTIANNFMNDLGSLLLLADTKDTNFFISTLLTAVLTHHLGWVSTIAPKTGSTEFVDSCNPDANQQERDKISKMSANHPYNVLWAQLGDLYGAVGHPVKLSKTIICGSSQLSNTIEKILNVLSYFIRCSEIRRVVHAESFEESKIQEAFNMQRLVTGTNEPTYCETAADGKASSSPKLEKNEHGMVRSATRMRNLRDMEGEAGLSSTGSLSEVLKKNVMNDIPNVLAYRDSRFVQQELRIGNTSMDTELLMNAKEKQYLVNHYHIRKENSNPQIRMTLTQPDETGQEAIELNMLDIPDDNSVRLSKLITDNNIGEGEKTQRLQWGDERVKEGSSLEPLKYIDGLRGNYEVLMQSKKDGYEVQSRTDVVFVLGENEQLVNIKPLTTSSDVVINSELGAVGGKRPCSHGKFRKHSIFNFGRYPKVVENYFKAQNLDLADYDILEKGMRLERAFKLNTDADLANYLDPAEEECEVCRSTLLSSLQTPTNASELEFTNDIHDFTSYSDILENASMSSLDNNHSKIQPYGNIPKLLTSAMVALEESNEFKSKHPSSLLKLVDIPMSKIANLPNANDENNNDKTDKLSKISFRAGFMPSLFSRINDHYIPDMILQGTTAPPNKWEKDLKKDLRFASRFAIMEQYPVENLAVVANLETYEVRIISPQTSSLGPSTKERELVGMSQLVSSMLESVHAMWTSGLSAFQCMSFIESKLREFYLQSETIASFLLATDFCTIGSITTALNITANDTPLLLSVASIHAPEVTRRYGLQLR